jgi:hypothetical protein
MGSRCKKKLDKSSIMPILNLIAHGSLTRPTFLVPVAHNSLVRGINDKNYDKHG